MLPYILMIVGGLMFLTGVFFLLSLALQPIKKMIGVIFKRLDDYVMYESAKGKQLLAHEMGIMRSLSFFLIIMGLLLFLLGFYLKNTGRGLDSLFVKETTGISQGEDYDETGKTGGVTKDNTYVTAEGKEYYNFICVKGAKLSLNGINYDSINALEGALKNLERNKVILIVDDYAQSAAIKKVYDLLDRQGFDYESEE